MTRYIGYILIGVAVGVGFYFAMIGYEKDECRRWADAPVEMIRMGVYNPTWAEWQKEQCARYDVVLP